MATFTVGVTVPAGSAPGHYSFQLLVAAQDNPDDDYAVSDLVTFQVPPEKPPPPFPWLLVGGIAAGVLVVIGAVFAWLFTIGPLGPPGIGAPSKVEFGVVNSAAGSGTKVVKITNTGHSDLKVSALQVTGSGFSGGKGTCVDQPVRSGQSCDVSLVLAPASFTAVPTQLTGLLTVFSNASNSPQQVSLSGSAHLVRLGATWESIPIAATDVASVPSGNQVTGPSTDWIFVISNMPTPGGFTMRYWGGAAGAAGLLPGGAVRMAADPKTGLPVCVNDGHVVFKYDNLSNSWLPLPGQAQDLAVDGSATIWIVATDGTPMHFDGANWTALAGAKGTRIAVDAKGHPWVLATDGLVNYWTGDKWAVAGNLLAQDVGVGADGVAWAAGKDSVAYLWDSYAGSWIAAPGVAATSISVDSDGLAVVATNTGQVFHRRV